jgi:hypothetical protein
MHRAFALLVALLCLNACGNGRGAHGSATDAPFSACQLPGNWGFGGSCISGRIDPAGSTFSLAAYRGIAVSMSFGANNSGDGVPFIIGNATGDGDISGKLNERIDFPVFGTAPCVQADYTATACLGKPLVYILIVNVGNVPVTFRSTPRIVVATTGRLRNGTRCAIDTMVWSHASPPSPVWLLRDKFAIASGGRLDFESRPTSQSYPSGGHFTVFAVVCDLPA